MQAKEKLGDQNAFLIADVLEIPDLNERDLKCCCPFHQENHASFIYNRKGYSFRCFAKETRVITKYGIYEIGDLAGKTVEIINGNGDWEAVTFKSFGFQKLMKVTLSRINKEKIIYATPEHEWLVQRRLGVTQTKDLVKGNRLAVMYSKPIDGLKPDPEGLIHGFMFGDGTLNRVNKGDGMRCYNAIIWDKKKYGFCLRYFDEVKPPMPKSPEMLGWCTYKTTRDFKAVPDIHEDPAYLLGFIAGLFVADGNCTDNSAIISSGTREHLEKIKDIATLLGIPTYQIGETIRHPWNNAGASKWARDFPLYTLRLAKGCIPAEFFVEESKAMELHNRNGSPALAYTVQSVEETDRYEEVFCCVTSTHSFVLEDFILTRNCFGACGRSYDLIDAYMYKGDTYTEAVKKLLDAAKMPYALPEHHVRTKRSYRYPHEEPNGDKTKVYEYLATRKISAKTADYLDIRQDAHGNLVFNYYDTNDVLTMVKYRPSRKTAKGENKNWCQKDADTTPLLFNMNRCNPSSPLLICSGELDCAAAIESGWLNAVSIPLGDQNTEWRKECADFLEQFDTIIICADNDESGAKYLKEILPRLRFPHANGRSKVVRGKTVNIPKYVTFKNGTTSFCKDLNEYLYFCGQQKTFDLILNASDTPIDSVVDLSDVEPIDYDDMDGIQLGLAPVDKELTRIFLSTLTVISGRPGCVSADTEFFNGTQWKKISEYKSGDKVLQYNADGTAELVSPERYIKEPCNSFLHYHTKYGIDQVVSDEHNMVYLTSKGNLAKKRADDMERLHKNSVKGFEGKFLTTFSFSGKGIDMTDDEIRVMCAVVCDGSLIRRKYTDTTCRINIKKARKKDRLRELLDKAGIQYREEHYNPKDLEYSTFLFTPPVDTKSLGADWYHCNAHQLKIIADEIVFWDGSETSQRLSFSTTDKDTADFVQFAFSSTGKRCVILENNRVGQSHGNYVRKSVEYQLTVTKRIFPSLHNLNDKSGISRVQSKDGYKYCFTVPSGMLVLRHNGKINITGNSGKSSLLAQLVCQAMEQGFNTWLFSGELPNGMNKGWMNYVLAGRHNIEKKVSRYGNEYSKIKQSAIVGINKKYKGQWFIYRDDWDNDISSLLQSMEDVVLRENVRLLILDNFMTIDPLDDKEELQSQTEIIKKLVKFAREYQVAVVLVCHPRKYDNGQEMDIYDIAGSSNIVNLAHRTIGLRRVTEKDRQNLGRVPDHKKKLMEYDVIMTIIKDRMFGRQNIDCGIFYDDVSRRFYTNDEEYDYQYSWDTENHGEKLRSEKVAKMEAADREVFGEVDKSA